MPTLMLANTTVTSRQRPPALPSFLMSPISATPSTIAEKISGMTTMKMMRRNTLPTGCVMFCTAQRTPGDGPTASSVTSPAAAPTHEPADDAGRQRPAERVQLHVGPHPTLYTLRGAEG